MNVLKRIINALSSRENNSNNRLVIPRKQGGMTVTHDTALSLSAVYACVRLISEDIAKLPWHTFKRDGDSRARVDGSRIEKILNSQPNPEMTSFSFRETLIAWALTWGNGYAEIQRDIGRRPVALWPISPDRVECKRDASGIYYEVSNGSGEKTIINQADMFHLHGLGFDGLTGYSVIHYASRTIGLGMAADQFGASFFGNNAVLGGYLKHPGELGDAAFTRLKEFVHKRKGPSEAFKPAILEEGMDWVQSGIPPEDAQFIETRKFTVTDIARWYRVPPHKIADLERATFSNIEEQEISYVNDTLVSWITRLEQEAEFKLINTRSQVDYTKINVKGLLRGSQEARSQFYKEMWNLGVYSVNEIRAFEDENPIGPDGDKRFVQLNMTTLEKAGEGKESAGVEAIEETQNKGIYCRLAEKTLIGVYAREDRRLRSSVNLVSESDYVDWMTEFYSGSHIDWVKDIITEALTAIACDIGDISLSGAIIDNYINRHVELGRKRGLGYYREDPQDMAEIAKAEANHLVNEVIDRHMIKRLVK